MQQCGQCDERIARRIEAAQLDMTDAMTHVVDTNGLLRCCAAFHVEHLKQSGCSECRFRPCVSQEKMS
jgi:hypothetical protein